MQVLDSSYSDVSFSAEAMSAMLNSLTVELARALHIPQSNIIFDSHRSVSGSIELTFDITSPSPSLSVDEIVANLTAQARSSHSALLTYGTWGPLIISASSKIYHSTNVCEHVLCSGHGTCFPDYSRKGVKTRNLARGRHTGHWAERGKAICVCQEGYKSTGGPNDCAKLIPGMYPNVIG